MRLIYTTREIGGRQRYFLNNPAEGMAILNEDYTAMRQSAIRKGFKNIRPSRMTAKQRQNAENFKKSIVAYAHIYGTPEQEAAFQKMSAVKLQWMYDQGIIREEVIFNYEGNIDSYGAAIDESAQDNLQHYIDAYNGLNTSNREKKKDFIGLKNINTKQADALMNTISDNLSNAFSTKAKKLDPNSVANWMSEIPDEDMQAWVKKWQASKYNRRP